MVKIDNVYIKKARRKRMIKKIIILIIFLIISCVVFATKTNFFSIKEIECTGENLLTGEDVRIRTEGLIGDNILFIKKSNIEKELKRNPYVENITLKKKLPNKLYIDVEERAGIYYVNEGNKFNIVSIDMILLEQVDNIDGKNLIELKGITIDDTELGSIIEDNARIKRVLYYFYRMRSELNEQGEDIPITCIDVSNLTKLKAYIGTIEVKLGNDEDIIKKFNKAVRIYKSGVVKSYIDVSFNGSPAFDTIDSK